MSTTPNNVDPARAAESNFGNMMAVNGTFCGLAIISVCLRVYVRLVLIKSFGWDDGVMVLALMFLVGGGLIPQIVAGVHGALGRHADTVSVEEMMVYGMMSFVQGVLMTVTSHCLVKISIALSLLRLNQNRWYKRVIWGFIAFILAYMVMGEVSLLAYCNPIKGHWDPVAFKTAKCYPRELVNLFASLNTGLNIFTDICFATLPIPMLWSLQMKRRVKLYLIAIFNLGYCAVIIGIVKLVCQMVTRGEPDKTYNNWIQFFGLLQQSIGIVAACIPMLRPLVARTLKLETSYAVPSHNPSQPRRSYFGSAARHTDTGRPDFELNDIQQGVDNDHGFHSSIRGGRNSDDGSETFILDGEKRKNVVVKTMEVTIR